MQRRAAAKLAQQALREFRDRAALTQTPAAFRMLHGIGSSGGAGSDGDGAQQPAGGAGAPAAAAVAPAAAAPPDTDAAAPKQPEARLAALFTCNKCDNRAMRSFSKQAYQDGVVIVQCPQCKARHLLADNLGWFGGRGNVEDLMRERGQEVRWQDTGGGALELTQADATAWAQAAAEAKTRQATKTGSAA